MKTLSKITLATLLMILFTTASFAGSFKKFRMQIRADQFIEVISKVENTIEEALPLEEKSVALDAASMEKFMACSKEEQLIEEELPLVKVSKLSVSVEELRLIVQSISQPEQEIEESFPFNNAYSAK